MKPFQIIALFGLFFALIAAPSEASDATIFPVGRYAYEGDVSSQNINVLSSLDLQGIEDGWSKYIEMSSGSDGYFKVLFVFELTDRSIDLDNLDELTVRANTIGLAKRHQRVTFSIRNFDTWQWTYIGDNSDASGWVWNDETFSVPESSGGFADYFSSSKQVQIIIESNNAADVVNIDYLAVNVMEAEDDVPEVPVESPEMADEILYPVGRSVYKGSVSSQSVSVLSTLTLEGTEDDWDEYIEMDPGSDDSFSVAFKLEPDDTSSFDPDSIESLTVRANTIGTDKRHQHRFYFILNYDTWSWEYIGDNSDASGWVWFDQTITVPRSNGGYSAYFSSSNQVQILIDSNNDADVTNIDYLVVQASGTSGGSSGGSDSGGDDNSGGSGGTSSWWSPKSSDHLSYQIQLQEERGAAMGTVDISHDVDMYEIDLFDVSTATIQALKDDGRVVVCYFSGGSYEGGRSDWAEFFDFIEEGVDYTGNQKPFAGKMDGWNERWLDIRELDLLQPIMTSRLELAVEKGCDAVDVDNISGYTHPSESGLDITKAEQLVYDRWMANKAHSLGLSIGLKNGLNMLDDLVDYFDWALNEECFDYNECDMYEGNFLAQDKAVFGIEYDLDPSVFCPEANSMGLSFVKKNLDLRAWRDGCEDY